jgi:UDP-glucose 4-epimerase
MTGRAFVVGGSGFLGRNAISGLLASGRPVTALRRRRSLDRGDAEDMRIVDGSLLDPVGTLAAAMAGCTEVIYLAGATTPASSADSPGLDVQENLLPFLNLLDAATLAGVGRIVFASSGGTVYGPPRSVPVNEDHPTNPTCSYGAVKLATEHLLRLWAERHGCRSIVLRISNPYGPHQECHGAQGVIAAWLPRAMAGETLRVWGDGRIVRDYIYVADVVSAIVAAASQPGLAAGIYNIGSGCGATLLEVAAALGRALGQAPKLEFAPARTCDVPVNVLDASRFRAATGWTPRIGLDQGMALAVAWRREAAQS